MAMPKPVSDSADWASSIVLFLSTGGWAQTPWKVWRWRREAQWVPHRLLCLYWKLASCIPALTPDFNYQLHTAAKIARGQTSWLRAPSFINSNSPSQCAQLCHHPEEACSPPRRLNRICPSHYDGDLRESAEGRKFPKKNICVCERFQVRSRPIPDALVSASRLHSWS